MRPDHSNLLEYTGYPLLRPTSLPSAAPEDTKTEAPFRSRLEAQDSPRPVSPVPAKPQKMVVLVLECEYRLMGALLFCLSREPHIVVHVLSREPHSPFRFSRYVRGHHRFPAEKPEAEFIGFVREVAAQTGAQVFLPVDVAGMRFAIAHRPQLEAFMRVLPLPEAEAYEIAADKSHLAAFMQERHIPAPDTILDLGPGLPDRLAGFEFPVLLKPVEGAGGRGITFYQDQASLLKAVAELPADSKFIIQNCLEGYDIDCNMLYQNGKLVAYSIQKGLVPAASEYAPTEAIEFVHNEAVLAVADQLMSALRWNGVAHLDLRYDAKTNQMRVIEVNTRFWLTVVGSAVTAKVNFPALACQAALGRPVPPIAYRLGRYIPFTKYFKRKFGSRAKSGISFTLQDTTLLGFLGDPLPKLYFLLHENKVRIG